MSAPNGLTTLPVPSAPLTPDQYKNYALQDPGFLGLQNALKGNEDAFKANARGGINRGVISLGVAPPDASLSPWLDSGTAAAAAANPLSTNAQFNEQHHQNVRAISNSLAARGGYDSGELTYGLGNENTRDTQSRSDALGKFMDYANGLFGNLGTMQASDAGQLGQEIGAAAMRQLALHPGSTTSATWNDATGTYVDGSGNHYDQYGNHIGTRDDGSVPTNFGIPTNPNSTNVADQQAVAAAMQDWNYKQAGSPAPIANPYPPTNPEQPITTQFSGGAGPNVRPY